MSPHRIITAAQRLPADTTTIAGATVSAALIELVAPVNLALLGALCVLMVVDQIAGMGKAYVLTNGIEWWDGQKFMTGVAKKVLYLLLVVLAATADFVGSLLPALGPVLGEITFGTKAVLAALIAGFIGSIAKNIRAASGAEATGALALIFRRLDAKHLGAEPPTRRHYDGPAIEAEQKIHEIEERP